PQQSGAPAEKVLPLYEINRETDREQQKIRNDATLTGEQKEQRLEAVLTAEQNALRKLLGDEIFQRYLRQNAKPRIHPLLRPAASGCPPVQDQPTPPPDGFCWSMTTPSTRWSRSVCFHGTDGTRSPPPMARK